MRCFFVFAAALVALSSFLCVSSSARATMPLVPAKDEALEKRPATATLVLAGGCFWGMEAVFEHVRGVVDVVSGYAGGETINADYETVSSGTTGHAEAVEITYVPETVTLQQLLDIYFTVAHNPTQLNYQGPDSGTQYRSTIFYASPEQQQVSEAYIAQLQNAKAFGDPIVTTLEPLSRFYIAEAYHQDYAKKHPDDPYIIRHDAPKVAALKKSFPNTYVERE